MQINTLNPYFSCSTHPMVLNCLNQLDLVNIFYYKEKESKNADNINTTSLMLSCQTRPFPYRIT